MKQQTIGFIGVGNMASAIVQGNIKAQHLTPQEIGLYDISPEATKTLTQQGCISYTTIPELVAACKTVVLSVKPQQFPQVLPFVKEAITSDTVLISIAAGISAETIKDAMGFDAKVILVMPNTALLVGEGASVLAHIPPVSDEEFAQAKALFATSGMVQEIPATKMTDSIPIHGSSPAFLYEFARVIVDSADAVGIAPDTALLLIGQTMVGSGKMLLESDKTPQELIQMVSSPGGTTLAGLKALEQAGFAQSIENAFSATIWRGKELAGGKPDPGETTLTTVDYGSEEYQAAKALREAVLREPLQLHLSESDLISDKTAIHICALQKGKVVGTCQLTAVDAFTVRVGQVAVSPELQKGGIGSLLLWKATQVATEKGYSRMTANSRLTAKSFYMRQGFLTRGSEFLELGIPHVSMYKTLSKPPEESGNSENN